MNTSTPTITTTTPEEDLDSQPLFVEAIGVGRYRLELHRYPGCAENAFEVRLLDLFHPDLPPLRINTHHCRQVANGLRLLEAMADAQNGDAKAGRAAERLRPLVARKRRYAESELLDGLMEKLDRDRHRHNARIDAERERLDRLHREQRLRAYEAAS